MKMRKYITEFIGAFFLVLAVCMSTGSGLGNWSYLASGIMLTVMIYAGTHISGAHFNPAVSLAVYLRGKLALGELPPYIFAQAAGGVLAALLSTYLLRNTVTTYAEPIIPFTGSALLAEFLGAFVLCYVILQVATSKGTSPNNFYGMAIGGTFMTAAMIFGNISGGVFNPALALGLCTAKIIAWKSIWIYLISDFVAAGVAAFVFNYLNGPE